MNNSSNLNEILADQMDTYMANSSKSSSSSSISSMESAAAAPPSELDMLLELVAAIDLNPTLFKSQTHSDMHSSCDDRIGFNKEKLIQYLKSYLENEATRMRQSVESIEDEEEEENYTNAIKLNELKSVLLSGNEINTGLKTINEDDSLPRHLIVTSVCDQVFSNAEIKSQFEKMFSDLKCKFCYLPTFKRCYIQFDSPVAAVLARVQLHDQKFLNEPLKIFLNKVSKSFLNFGRLINV